MLLFIKLLAFPFPFSSCFYYKILFNNLFSENSAPKFIICIQCCLGLKKYKQTKQTSFSLKQDCHSNLKTILSS